MARYEIYYLIFESRLAWWDLNLTIVPLVLTLLNEYMSSLSNDIKLLYVLMSFAISIRLILLLALEGSSHRSLMWYNAVSKLILIFRLIGVLAVIGEFLCSICFFFSVVVCIFLLSISEVSLLLEESL